MQHFPRLCQNGVRKRNGEKGETKWDEIEGRDAGSSQTGRTHQSIHCITWGLIKLNLAVDWVVFVFFAPTQTLHLVVQANEQVECLRTERRELFHWTASFWTPLSVQWKTLCGNALLSSILVFRGASPRCLTVPILFPYVSLLAASFLRWVAWSALDMFLLFLLLFHVPLCSAPFLVLLA